MLDLHEASRNIFTTSALEKLAFTPFDVGAARGLESAPVSWASASSYVSRARSSAAAAGIALLIAEREVAEVRPNPATLELALRAVDDDAVYSEWLSRFIAKHRAELAPLVPEIETHLASSRKARGGSWSAQHPVRVVCLSGVPDSAAPVLFGLGPFNDCPEPEVHAAVLGRWSREFGAKIHFVGHDRLHLRVESPPVEVAPTIWAAIAATAYVSDTAELFDFAELVRGDTWRFWWD